MALQCARKVLEEPWPKPYSIEQRYLYHPKAGVLETVYRELARMLEPYLCEEGGDWPP